MSYSQTALLGVIYSQTAPLGVSDSQTAPLKVWATHRLFPNAAYDPPPPHPQKKSYLKN